VIEYALESNIAHAQIARETAVRLGNMIVEIEALTPKNDFESAATALQQSAAQRWLGTRAGTWMRHAYAQACEEGNED
jgi:hypothetical protein